MDEAEDRVSTIDLIEPVEDTRPSHNLFLPKNYRDPSHENDKFKAALKDEHMIEHEELFGRYETNPTFGLNEDEANRRNEEYGDNTLLISRFPMIGLYIGVAIFWIAAITLTVLYMMGNYKYFLVIGGASLLIAIVVTFSTINVSKKNNICQKKIREFESLLEPQVRVTRNGVQCTILPTKLVPGDIIYLYAGIKVSCDIRIIECYDLKVNYSNLTGDVLDLERTAEKSFDENPILADNVLLCGSECIDGSAKGVVLRIGEYSVVGKTLVSELH